MLPAKIWKFKVDTGERRHVERHGVVRRDGHGFSGYSHGGIRRLSRRHSEALGSRRRRGGFLGGSSPDGAEERCRGEERENHRAGSPARTAALDVATAPVKKLQASLRRDYNRKDDGYVIL
jgi:hypothetical protein